MIQETLRHKNQSILLVFCNIVLCRTSRIAFKAARLRIFIRMDQATPCDVGGVDPELFQPLLAPSFGFYSWK